MTKKVPSKSNLLEMIVDFGRVNIDAKAIFLKHLSVMLKSGIPINEALNITKDSASGKLRKILTKVLKSVESGRSLADSFAAHPKIFSSFFIHSVSAGEDSGTLEYNLSNLSEQLEKSRELKNKIKGVMTYPIIVLSATFVLGLGLSFLVLPKIMPLFENLNVKLPLTTRMLIWLSHAMENYGLYILLAIFVLIIFLFWLFRQSFIKPSIHWVFLKIPFIKRIVKHSNLANFTLSLGVLLKSGLNLDEAINIAQNTVNNYYYQQSLTRASRLIKKGTSLSRILSADDQLFPKLVTRMIKVGEESGSLAETLYYLANFYEKEVDLSVKTFSRAIEPILLGVVGVIVAFFALSIITPIYSITGNIRG